MKILTRILQFIAVLAVFAMAHAASAANRTFAAVTPNPTSTNVPSGVATTNTSTVSIRNGSGASTRFVGTALITASVSPAEATITASLNPTNLVYPTSDTTLTSTLAVTTTAGTPAGTYLIRIVANTNPPAQSNIIPVTNTFTLNVGAVFMPQKIWSPAGVNTNWSTPENWTQSGAPTPSNDVDFFDTGAVGAPGIVDNVVDASLTIGSLTYGQTNIYHTTLIPSGVTLTVGGDANGLAAGTGTDNGNSQVTVNTITGAGGTLIVSNASANVFISQSHNVSSGESAAQTTLDLSGLDNFSATVSRLLVGVDLTVALKGASGVLNLAKTNTITATAGSAAPQIDVGDNTQAQGAAAVPSILLLGQTNAFFADSIAVGRGKTDNTGSSMLFNSTFASPTAYFRGTNGATSRVGTWSIGDANGSKITTFTTAVGTCDFSLGTVNALVDTMFVGKGASTAIGSGANTLGLGTLTFGAGTIDVNTLQVGVTASVTGAGTVNASGGALLVNTLLELANGSGSSGTLNISNATVTANIGVIAGGGTATINMLGGTLNVTNSTADIGTVASPINTFGVSNSTLNLAVQSFAPSVAVSTLTVDGTANTINISSVPLLTGFPTQFPIIQYGLNGGGSSGDLTTFVLGTLPSASPTPYGAFLSNNVANNSIDIVFTNGPFVPTLTWDGVPTGDWDITTPNWRPKSGPDTAYGQGNFVTFDDTLTGTPNVNLTTALSPASVTVSNAAVNYLFSGAGSISGGAALVKNGSGTLTMSETGGDNFSGGVFVNNGALILDDSGGAISGGTTINGGTIQIGNNDASGALPLGGVSDSGALIFNRADNIIVTNAISGAGTLTQGDTNILTLSGNSTFAGMATVAQGTLQVGSTNGLGLATSVTVSNGATFDVDGKALFGNGNSGLIVTVSGAGVGGNGAIVNSGASQTKVLHTVTLAAAATFGGTGDWDIRNSSGNSATADATLSGAFNLTKTGTNSISFRGVTVDTGLGNIDVQAGSLTFTATASAPLNSLGNSSATATVFSNAMLTLDTIGTVPAKNFVLNNGGTLKSSGTNTLNSPVTLSGAANNTISVGTGAQFTITSAIGGGGGFSKNGSSVLFLTANNTYSGNTVVSGGTLALYGGGSDGSISSSLNVNINSGSTIDVSGRSDGTLTLASGQTLIGGFGTNGAGTVNGILVAGGGSTLAPGTGTTNIGTLSAVSNATLQGAAILKISATNGNDQLDAAAITYGGTLVVTNFSGAVTNGQSFQLFVATNGIYNAGTFSSVTLPSATGLTWTNNLTVNGTITAGVVTGPPAQPQITSVSLSGTSLVISGTNGTAGLQFEVLTSTNVALALTNWTSIATNTFGSGNFSVTNTVNPSVPQNFYILRVP